MKLIEKLKFTPRVVKYTSLQGVFLTFTYVLGLGKLIKTKENIILAYKDSILGSNSVNKNLMSLQGKCSKTNISGKCFLLGFSPIC